MVDKGANSWKNRSKKAKAKTKSLLKKRENQRCLGCLNKSHPLIYKTRIENEDESTQIRINETNTQSSNSDIGNKNGRGHGYDVCGKGEIIHSSRKYFHAGILNEIAD